MGKLKFANVIAVITAVLAIVAIIAQVAEREIRCLVGLDDCPTKQQTQKVESSPTIEKSPQPAQLTPKPTEHVGPVNIKHLSSKYFEEYQVSLSVKFTIVYDESLARLTVTPKGSAAFTQVVLAGYNLEYSASGNDYQISILNIDYDKEVMTLTINKYSRAE